VAFDSIQDRGSELRIEVTSVKMEVPGFRIDGSNIRMEVPDPKPR
jgi:hypothetical protein